LKKIFSISLSEKLVQILDQYCLKNGFTRSEAISKLIVDHLNDGKNPDEKEEDKITKAKVELLYMIYDLFFSANELKEFSTRFDLEISLLEESLTILFESSNRKFYSEVKIIEDSIKINARYNSSSRKMQEIFEEAYQKHREELEQHGFERKIYQRFWSIEYKSQIGNYLIQDEIDIIARFILQKLMVLYTHFFIELDFIIDSKEAEELLETGPLKEYGATSSHIEPPYLQVLIGAKRGVRYPVSLGSPTIIGRINTEINLSEQEFDAKKPVVSKQHAKLFWKKDKLYVVDLGSTNGTSLNGKVISEPDRRPGKEYELAHGDRILIANIELKLVLN